MDTINHLLQMVFAKNVITHAKDVLEQVQDVQYAMQQPIDI